MGILSYKQVDENLEWSRGFLVGPRVVCSPAYGISLTLPDSWVTTVLLGEIYGIESLSRNDGRIHVNRRVANLEDIIDFNNHEIDLGYHRFRSVSIPCVENNKVFVHGIVEGIGFHSYAYNTTVVTEENNAISFIAMYEESAALYFQKAVKQLAYSVKVLPRK